MNKWKKDNSGVLSLYAMKAVSLSEYYAFVGREKEIVLEATAVWYGGKKSHIGDGK